MSKVYLLVFLFVSACSSKPHAINFDLNQTELNSEITTIYIVSHGWHTGIIIPASDIQQRLPQLKTRFASALFLEFGWGDRGFYQADEIGAGLVFSALFWPTESVIHIVAVEVEVSSYFSTSDIIKICLNNKQYAALLDFITKSFYQNDQAELKQLGKGIYGSSQFYQGKGDYYLTNTCNKWTAKAFQSMGFDISPLFHLTADSVMDFVQQLNDIQSSHRQLSNTQQNSDLPHCR